MAKCTRMRAVLVVFVAFLGFVIFRFLKVDLKGNNTCRNFDDYGDADNNENCWYNEDYRLSTAELIAKYAGTVETHEVISEDGYITTMHRIPRKEAKGVMFMEHSLATDSHFYVAQGNESMALYFWRDGYDVWLDNQRGTPSSLRHVRLTDADPEYWNFSFTELGSYDVSSKIEYIRSKTNDTKVIYFGQSLGTTVGLAFASLKPEEARESIKVFILVSLAYRYKNGRSSYILYLTSLAAALPQMFRCTKVELGQNTTFHRYLTRAFPSLHRLIYKINLILHGHTQVELDPALYNFDILSLRRTFSCQVLWHYFQMFSLGTPLQMFDYGTERNIEIYGTDPPPLYPLWNITTPVYAISGTADILTTAQDAKEFYEILPDSAKIYGGLEIPGFNHEDYYVSKSRKKDFVDKVLQFMNENLSR